MARGRRLCPDDELSAITASMRSRGKTDMHALDALLHAYPDDARLHFLKGSVAAGMQDFGAAHMAMRRAVDLAPGYAVARFQLGLLLLTSAQPDAAQNVWEPLHALPADNYLRLFASGLDHLIRDEFDDAIRSLKEGMARNLENPVMNRDMQMIVDKVSEGVKDDKASHAATSSVNFLLRQAALKSRLH